MTIPMRSNRMMGARWVRQNSPVLIAAMVAFAVGATHVSWRTLAGQDPSTNPWALGPQAIEVLLSAAAAVALFLGSKRLTGTARTSWRLIATAGAVWAVGSTVWISWALNDISPDSAGPADLMHLVAAPLIAAGILLYPSGRRRERAVRSLIDGLLVSVSLLLILWTLGLRINPSSGPGTYFGHSEIHVLHPLITTFLIVMVVVLVFTTRDSNTRSFVLLGLALTAIVLTQSADLLLEESGVWGEAALVLDTGWATGFVLLTAAGFLMEPRSTSTTMTGPELALQIGGSTPIVVVPATLGAVAMMVGIIELSTGSDAAPYTIPALLIVAGLMIARQSYTLNQRRGLTKELAQSVSELSHEASHDRLTGLPNRSRLLNTLNRKRSTARAVIGVLFLDIDHLKAINDSLGHQVGDQLIRDTAEMLTDQLGKTTVTRFGGDEFVATITARTGPEVWNDALKITRQINHADPKRGSVATPSVSAGLAIWNEDIDAEEILRRADTALYEAKSSGRQSLFRYSPDLDADTRRRVELEPDLMVALERGELRVHYQPVVSLGSDSVIGAEALVRWDHPTLGLLQPKEFLGHADASGLLEGIGNFVLETAVENFAELNRSNPDEPLQIAVNMSASELVANEAVRAVTRALARSGLDPSQLMIEITEDVVLDDATRATIDQLTEIGVSIAIDDFGTGNSSLRQLGEYPARTLKVDRTFIRGLGINSEDTLVVRSILKLAKNMGLTTIAEGVESITQLDLLRQLGCDAAQGWYFDRARPFPELREGHLRAISPLDLAALPAVSRTDS